MRVFEPSPAASLGVPSQEAVWEAEKTGHKARTLTWEAGIVSGDLTPVPQAHCRNPFQVCHTDHKVPTVRYVHVSQRLHHYMRTRHGARHLGMLYQSCWSLPSASFSFSPGLFPGCRPTGPYLGSRSPGPQQVPLHRDGHRNASRALCWLLCSSEHPELARRGQPCPVHYREPHASWVQLLTQSQ